MAAENCYHKLVNTDDFGKIQTEGFKASVPAEKHWLGKGVYFFLDPKGYYWAKRWPFNGYSDRTDSSGGIIASTIETSDTLDFRVDEIRNKSRSIVNKLKLRLRFSGLKVSDGAAFALLFKEAIFREIVDYVPTGIIANFDEQYAKYRIEGSGVFLTIDEMEIRDTAQVQACVIDGSIVGKLALCKTS